MAETGMFKISEQEVKQRSKLLLYLSAGTDQDGWMDGLMDAWMDAWMAVPVFPRDIISIKMSKMSGHAILETAGKYSDGSGQCHAQLPQAAARIPHRVNVAEVLDACLDLLARRGAVGRRQCEAKDL